MNILMICHRIPWPLNEGGTIAIYNNLRGYAMEGHTVTLLALNAAKHRINLGEARSELDKYCRFASVNIQTDVRPFKAFLNLFTRKSYNVERFYNKDFELLVEKYLRENAYDLIQLEGTYAAPYTPVVMKHRNYARVVLRQHNVEHQIWQRLASSSSNYLTKWYLNLLARRLQRFEEAHLNQYDALIAITDDDAARFREMGCRIPVHVAPAGIDTGLWSPSADGIHPGKLYHLGSLEWRPNRDAVEWLLDEVWPLVLEKNPDIELFIAGKGMPETLQNRKIRGVHMEGQVTDAVEFVQDKGVCIVPLRSGSGIRVKILEAMSAGKPVISTTVGAQGIRCRHGENILIADSAEDFASTIIQLHQDSALYRQLASAGRSLIEQEYSNAAVVKRLIAFINDL